MFEPCPNLEFAAHAERTCLYGCFGGELYAEVEPVFGTPPSLPDDEFGLREEDEIQELDEIEIAFNMMVRQLRTGELVPPWK